MLFFSNFLVFEYFIIVSIGVVLFICVGRQLLQNVMGAEPVRQVSSVAELTIPLVGLLI